MSKNKSRKFTQREMNQKKASTVVSGEDLPATLKTLGKSANVLNWSIQYTPHNESDFLITYKVVK